MKNKLTIIAVIVAVIGLLLIIAVPAFIISRNTAAQNACISNLRIIDAGKEQYAMARADTNAVSSYIRKTEMHYGDEYTGENTPKENSSITGYTATNNGK